MDAAIQQFSKEIDGNAKVEEISQLDIDQLIAVEKVLMEEGKTVEDDSAERLRLLSQNQGQVEGEKLEITRLELAVANNETCIDGMSSKVGFCKFSFFVQLGFFSRWERSKKLLKTGKMNLQRRWLKLKIG